MGKITNFNYQPNPDKKLRYTVFSVGSNSSQRMEILIEYNSISECKYSLSFSGDISFIDERRETMILWQGSMNYGIDVDTAKPFENDLSGEMILSMLQVHKNFMQHIYNFIKELKEKTPLLKNAVYPEFTDDELLASLRMAAIKENPALS